MARFAAPRTALLLLALPLATAPLPGQQTRPERTDGAETSHYADVTGFLDSLARRTPDLRVGVLGHSPEGRPIPWVLAARPMVDSPGDAQRSGKPILYLQANIHSGEVEGKEAAQMLLRDLTVGPLHALLDSVILLVVPIYNIDGNERFGPGDSNRAGQNGPAVVGPSVNGQGLNLNRDYVKLEAPETVASLALLERWEPDFFIDHQRQLSRLRTDLVARAQPQLQSGERLLPGSLSSPRAGTTAPAPPARDLSLRQLPQPGAGFAGPRLGDLRRASPLRHQFDGHSRADPDPLRGLQQ
jgi:hypothetical protein